MQQIGSALMRYLLLFFILMSKLIVAQHPADTIYIEEIDTIEINDTLVVYDTVYKSTKETKKLVSATSSATPIQSTPIFVVDSLFTTFFCKIGGGLLFPLNSGWEGDSIIKNKSATNIPITFLTIGFQLNKFLLFADVGWLPFAEKTWQKQYVSSNDSVDNAKDIRYRTLNTNYTLETNNVYQYLSVGMGLGYTLAFGNFALQPLIAWNYATCIKGKSSTLGIDGQLSEEKPSGISIIKMEIPVSYNMRSWGVFIAPVCQYITKLKSDFPVTKGLMYGLEIGVKKNFDLK